MTSWSAATTMCACAWDLAGWPNETLADWKALADDVASAVASIDAWSESYQVTIAGSEGAHHQDLLVGECGKFPAFGRRS